METSNEQTSLNLNTNVVDYKTVKIDKGQYWIRHNNLVAFVLDVNQYAVIYQFKVNLEESLDQLVFDYEAGQELMTIDTFRKHLNDKDAIMVYPEKSAVDSALKVYQSMLKNNQIFQPKTLPQTEKEYKELLEYEHYTLNLRIIPPPIEYRKKKGLHWFKAGTSGTHFVCKLWDPDIDNWVYPTGSVDITSGIGFVSEYLAPADVKSDKKDKEDYQDLVNRIVVLLKRHTFFFDEDFIRDQIHKFKPLLSGSDDVNTYDNVHIYHLTYNVSGDIEQHNNDKLHIYLSLDDRVLWQFVFEGIQNNQFIPNKSVELKMIY